MRYALLILLLSSCANNVSVFGGLDHTSLGSPLCTNYRNDRGDKQLTSNLGVKANLYKQNAASIDVEYRHHSCVMSVDEHSYNAVGFTVNYELWSKD